MQQAYIDICGVPTRVITYGKWIEDGFTTDEPKDIILIIPGNPGVTEFYCKFMETLYEQIGYPVWIVGHTGHELPPDDDTYSKLPSFAGNERLYGLDKQTLYKQAFIEKYLPDDARIHFIGHSIGARIVLQLLKIPSIKSQAVKNYLLFPTIEYMSDAPNGVLLTKIVCHIVWLLVFLSWIFTLLPSILQSLLIRIYTTYYKVPTMHSPTIIKFVHPETLRRVFHMALDEMVLVKERDMDILIENKKKTKLYYGAADRWAPQSYCEQLKKDIPDIDAQICTQKFEHAFVLRFSVEVAKMVASWIRTK